jgi:hypothetical protein
MHTYRPGNLRDEIPKEGGFGSPRAVTPCKKKEKEDKYSADDCKFQSASSSTSGKRNMTWYSTGKFVPMLK